MGRIKSSPSFLHRENSTPFVAPQHTEPIEIGARYIRTYLLVHKNRGIPIR